MENDLNKHQEINKEKNLENIERELKQELNHVRKEESELKHTEERIERTLSEVEKLEKEEHEHRHRHHQHSKTETITFIVNGKTYTDTHVNINTAIEIAVNEALEKTGNTGRPLSDWQVKFNDQDLNIHATPHDLHIPNEAKIFVSLKTAQGGRK